MTKPLLLITIFALHAATTTCTSASAPRNVNQQQQAAPATPSAVNNERIKRQAQELSDAMLSADFEKAADLTHLKLIELMGGRAQFIAAVRQAMKQTQSEQFRIESVTVGEPRDHFDVKNEKYVIVPTTMKMKVPEGVLVGDAFMIGVSLDGGNNWKFVDSGGKSVDRNALKTLLPLAANKLQLPEVKKPTLYRQ